MAKLEKIKNIDYTIDFNENFDKNALTEIYKKYGFVQVKNLLNSSLSKNLLSSALYFYKQNANKLGFFTRTKGELKQLDYFVRKLEKEDRDVAVCAQKLLARIIKEKIFTPKSIISFWPAILDFLLIL